MSDWFFDIIHNKSVIFCGPSPIMLNYSMGKFIDSFDTVVRINTTPLIITDKCRDYGKRTDVVYLSEAFLYRDIIRGVVDGLEALNVKVICLRSSLTYEFLDNRSFVYRSIPPDEQELISKFSIYTTHKPLTGTVLLCDILNYHPKRLHVTGIDLFYDRIVRKKRTNKDHLGNYNSGDIIGQEFNKNDHNFKDDARIIISMLDNGLLHTDRVAKEAIERVRNLIC